MTVCQSFCVSSVSPICKPALRTSHSAQLRTRNWIRRLNELRVVATTSPLTFDDATVHESCGPIGVNDPTEVGDE